MNYRRVFVPGASYFFTLTLQDRRSDLLICKIKELRIAFQRIMKTSPFTIDGIVVLPEHMHMTMTLPPDDTNYSQRISFIKSAFSRPNNTKSRQLSAPQMLPHKTTNKISMSGYNFVLEILGSDNSEK